jgi:hypothetical protein
LGQRWRTLRGRVLTPNVSATKLDVRGFHKKSPAAQELLEKVGATFLDGYRHAAEARTVADAAAEMDKITPRFRGFAYEGAGMGFAVRDGLPLGPTRLSEQFLAGPGDIHNYMVYVGIGWAMARLPRFRWPDGDKLDLLLRWLLLDGYGFHQAYFHTQRYVTEQYQNARFPWPNRSLSDYANRAIDQGIGRALWFINGTDAARTNAAVAQFAESRRSDLYAGVGLAATYAGGAEEAELRILFEGAGEYRTNLAQGSAFAAECRIRAGLLVPHNAVATQVLCGATPEQAARVALDYRPDRGVEGDLPAYEVWRQRVAAEFGRHANATDLGKRESA